MDTEQYLTCPLLSEKKASTIVVSRGKSVLRPLRSSIIVSMMELTVATVLIKVNKLIMKELAGRIEIHLPSSACLMRALRKKFFWECFN